MTQKSNSNAGIISATVIWAAVFIFCLCMLCKTGSAQSWQYQNRGLYPSAFHLTINPKNTAVGLMYSYLFQHPVLNMPIGVYGSASRTIDPNLWYNNYEWEYKFSVGFSITLPMNKDHPEVHTMCLLGLNYYQLPGMWQNDALQPGQYYSNLKATNPIGLDMGVRMQVYHSTVSLLIDAMNFFQYAQLSYGRCFSFNKSQ
jgi:hypothetical protein